MNTDEREERIAIVAEGCKISQDEAEKKVDGWKDKPEFLNDQWFSKVPPRRKA